MMGRSGRLLINPALQNLMREMAESQRLRRSAHSGARWAAGSFSTVS